MDHFEKQEKIRAAKRRLRAQRVRAGALRGRVVAISLITFVLLWAVVFAQMATGNDPVLGGGSSSTRKSAVVAEATTEAIETTEPDEVESQLAEPEPVEEEPVEIEAEPVEPEPVEEELAPVTTGQS